LGASGPRVTTRKIPTTAVSPRTEATRERAGRRPEGPMPSNCRIAIVGGGLAGIATAQALKSFGIKAEVFEAAPVLGEIGAAVNTSLQAVKALRAMTLATRAVANAGPTPGISSSRLLASLDRCQALIIRSNSRICFLRTRSWAPSAARHARATSGTRLSVGSAMIASSSRHHGAQPALRSRTPQGGLGSH
jgi:glycine/D-amino acid oxidase-like deaminating enzyme